MVELQRGRQFENRARAACRRGNVGDRDGFDAVAEAIDIQINGVPGGDVAGAFDVEAGVAGVRVRRQVGLRARLADGGDGDHFILFHGIQDDGVGGAVAEAELLADLDGKAAVAARTAAGRRIRHIGGAGGNRDDGTIRQGLP